VYKIQYKTQ